MTAFKKPSRGERGKYAEKEVEKLLKHVNLSYAGFAYERLPDARAARGAIKAQLCDFMAHVQYGENSKYFLMIEVKEIQHDYRLPKDKLEQLPRMRKWMRAGAHGVVIIFHSTFNKWRCVKLAWFDGEIPPSWDLRDVPAFDRLEDAIDSVREFPIIQWK